MNAILTSVLYLSLVERIEEEEQTFCCINVTRQYNGTKVDGLVFRQLERTCYYRCGYKRDVEELLASENECFLNPRLVYEQYFG